MGFSINWNDLLPAMVLPIIVALIVLGYVGRDVALAFAARERRAEASRRALEIYADELSRLSVQFADGQIGELDYSDRRDALLEQIDDLT